MSNLSIEKQIVIIAHIQNYLAGHSEIKNQAYLYSKIKSSLQHLMNETISGLEPKSLDELVDELRTFAGHEQIALFDEMITENRVQQIKNLRKHAIGQNRPQNRSIDLSIFYPGYTHIPIEVFSWQSKIEKFNRLVSGFSELTYESFCTSSLDFFGHIGEGCLPTRLPEPTDRIIQELISRQLVSPMDAGDLIDDVNRIRRKISDIRKENRKKIYDGELCADSFARMGDDAYGFLNDYWHNSDLKNKFDICEYLVHWTGPGKAGFLKRLVEESPCDKHFELCLACTGVYPKKNVTWFKSRADIESKKEQKGFEKVQNIIQENKFVYDFLYISNFEGQGEILQSQRWESLFEKNRHLLKAREELKEPIVQKAFAFQKGQEARKQSLVKSKPESLDEKDTPDVVFSADDIDIENLSAYEKPLKGQDKIAHEHSTWNKYLKPFLSENLLGILGAALLMLAWLCISIWVWNKGHYYRLLTGALPMYLTSFCLAFISRFFHKNLDKGVSARAPAMFAGLCVLSIPFNYLVALSMFNMNNVIGPLAGIGLAIVYGFSLIFIIGKKIKDSFGFNPGAYLTLVNTILLLSALLLFISREMRFLAVHIILFATFFIMAYQVYRLNFREPSTHRFCTLVFAGNYLLTIFICCVYYRVVPDPGSIAVLAQLISLFIIYTDSIRQVYKQMIVAAVISILGILICLNAVLPLMPVCMALSFWAWFQFKRKVDSYWLDDILVGHIFLLSGAVLFELQALIFPHRHLLMPWIALSGALGIACSYVYEKKHRETKSVSLMLIFVLLSFQVVLLSPGLNTITGLSLVMLLTLAVGVYGYNRYARLYLKRLWFINLAILLAAPSLGLAVIGLEDEAKICLAFSGLAWTLISPKLKDALAHSNKTGVAFVLNIVAGCAFIHVCLTGYPSFSKAGFLLVPAFIALLVSLAVTARKTMSQLPVYAVFLIAAIFGSMVWEMTGIQMKSGLGTSIAALAALFLSHQFKVRSTWQAEAYDMVFNHELLLRSKSFLYFPFELAGWTMAVMALIKASLHFALLNSGPRHFNVHAFKVILALMTVLAVFCYFIKKYNFKNCGYIVLWPIGFILVSVSSYVPLVFIAPWCLVLFFLYDYCCRAVTIKPDYKESISIPMKQLNFIFNYFSIAFAFFLYPFYMVLFPGSGPGRILLAASVVMAVVYIHNTLVVKKIERYGHLVPLHLIILIVLGYCSFNRQPIIDFLNTPASKAFLNILVPYLLKLLILVAATLFIPGFIFEKRDNKLVAGYCRIFHVWLFAAACIIGVIIPAFLAYQVFYPLHPDPIKNLPYIIVAGLFLVHAGNRYFHSLFLYGMKAYFCVCTAFLVFNSLFTALISGMILFSLFEGLLILGIKHDICRPMESRPGKTDYKRRLAHACDIFVFACLTVHFVGFLTLSKPLNHFLLYLLIPYMLFSYRARIKDSLIKDFLGFATVGIFAYANAFVFLICYPVFLNHQLNSLHLFSASVIFTIAAFQIYEKIKSSIKQEAAK